MSVMRELKAEISRLARKEIKKELEPVKRVNAMQRGLIANLRRDVTELQREIKQLRREVGAPEPVKKEGEVQKLWILGKGIVSMRKRLGLTQSELARLAGVSTQSVVNWEKVEGKVAFRRQATLHKLQEIRAMGKTQAREALDQECPAE